MRLKLTLLLCLSSLIGSAQFFVKEGTTLSFTTPETILSSQESLNQIEATIQGKGTLYLNSSSQQQLASTQTDLELPSLFIQNAHLVQIQTALQLQHLEIENGLKIKDHRNFLRWFFCFQHSLETSASVREISFSLTS